MIGDTFPDKADPNSIRGTLFAQANRYGFEHVTIANNAVHLSAGPFEAGFEIVNFVGNLYDLDLKAQPPLVIRRTVEKGVTIEQALDTFTNPTVVTGGHESDLFSATEGMNTDSAVELWLDGLSRES